MKVKYFVETFGEVLFPCFILFFTLTLLILKVNMISWNGVLTAR